MNEFDQFVKHQLKAKYYIRYADDFVVLHEDKTYLESVLAEMKVFLESKKLAFISWITEARKYGKDKERHYEISAINKFDNYC
mgnify:FL=1